MPSKSNRMRGAGLGVGCGLIAAVAIGGMFAMLPPPVSQVVTPVPECDTPEIAIDGRSLDDWRELMKSLPINDPERGHYVPGLVQIVRSPQIPWFTRRQAAQTLGRWGEPAQAAVPVLESLLQDSADHEDETTRFWALKGLSLFGPVAASAGNSVGHIAAGSHHTVGERLAAMECLSQIGSAYPPGIASLTQILHSSENTNELRRGAVEALGLFRGGASVAVPALVRCLEDSDPDLRREAAASLGRQGPAAELAQPSLLDRLVDDPDAAVRDAAGTALAQTGPSAVSVVAVLLEAPDAELRTRAVRVIGQIGARAATAASLLRPLWNDPSEEVRLAALESSWKITRQGTQLAPRVAELLTSEERNIRRQAYLLLIALGPSAVSARPILEQQRTHERSEVRAVAERLLRQWPAE